MTHKLSYPDGGRRLVLEIFDDADRPDIDRIVRRIYQWHERRLAGSLVGVQTREAFDAWCYERSKKGGGTMTAPQIAREVNTVLADLLREHVRRMQTLEAMSEGMGKGPQPWEVFYLHVKTGIEAGDPALEAERLLGLARPETQDNADWLRGAVENIRNRSASPFGDPKRLTPVDPKTVSRAITRAELLRKLPPD